MSRRAVITASLIFCVVLGLSLFQHIFRLFSPRVFNHRVFEVEPNLKFSWAKLPPSKQLEWRDCLPGRQCARLIVPLNYSDPQGREATIALVRKPASVSDKSNSYRGPVLFNPGGPGGSGVKMISGPGADLFSTILGPEFDIVGFDPRGIENSTPRISFFKTDVERALWQEGIPAVNNSDDGIARTWARYKVFGQLAAEQDDGYLRHMNTDQTARDMLSIVEAHGREKILYWGFSYGTVLGSTFAAMFPDKIERMVIDGVLDAEDYYTTELSSSLLDTDKTLQSFLNGCVDAGPDICPFYAPNAAAIRQNLTNLYETVRSNPLPVKTETTYGILDYQGVRSFVLLMLYSPYTKFASGAQALAELAAGDGRMMFEMLNPPEAKFKCSCNDDWQADAIIDAQAALVCNDGDDVHSDLEETKKFFEMMAKKSEWGDILSAIRMNCIGWPKFPKNRFRGPFTANTSHPILVIGNTADPVTPLWSAKKVSRGFNGSVVLTQDSPGHCSIAAPSVCTQKYVRDYFVHGTLPVPNTVCQPISLPFPAATANYGIDVESETQAIFDSNADPALTAIEREIGDAVEELSRMSLITRWHW